MRQVIKHRDIRLLNMIRRTDPEIHCYQVLYLPHNVYNNEQASRLLLACPAIIPPGLVLFRPLD